MTSVLGLNAYHGDASAALVCDGELVAAVEEERFNRIKHWAGFPAESVRYCLEAGNLKPRDLDHVAISFDPRANFGRRVGFVLQYRPSTRAVLDRIRRQRMTLGIKEQFARAVGQATKDIRAIFHRVEHHPAHVAASFLVSPFEDASVLSIDGMGDFTSTLAAHGTGASWRELQRVFFPHSIGFLYNAVTMYLGFPHYGDEYKVMGLAPYGQPEYADLFRRIIRRTRDAFELNLEYFLHHRRGIRMTWNDGAPMIEPFHSELLERVLGPMRKPGEELSPKHENIASSLQVVTEEIITHLLQRLHDRTKCANVCLTGGVAMNSVANGKVTRQTLSKGFMFQPARRTTEHHSALLFMSGAVPSISHGDLCWITPCGVACQPMTNAPKPSARRGFHSEPMNAMLCWKRRLICSLRERSSAGSRDAWSSERGLSGIAHCWPIPVGRIFATSSIFESNFAKNSAPLLQVFWKSMLASGSKSTNRPRTWRKSSQYARRNALPFQL